MTDLVRYVATPTAALRATTAEFDFAVDEFMAELMDSRGVPPYQMNSIAWEFAIGEAHTWLKPRGRDGKRAEELKIKELCHLLLKLQHKANLAALHCSYVSDAPYKPVYFEHILDCLEKRKPPPVETKFIGNAEQVQSFASVWQRAVALTPRKTGTSIYVLYMTLLGTPKNSYKKHKRNGEKLHEQGRREESRQEDISAQRSLTELHKNIWVQASSHVCIDEKDIPALLSNCIETAPWRIDSITQIYDRIAGERELKKDEVYVKAIAGLKRRSEQTKANSWSVLFT